MATGLNPQRIKTQLSPGSFYWMHHTSKGRILVKLLAVKPTPEGDLVDEVLLHAAIPCGHGSGQEAVQVAFYYDVNGAKRPVPLRIMDLRPSKITQTEVPSQEDIDTMEFCFDEFDVMKARPTAMPAVPRMTRRQGIPPAPEPQEIPLGTSPTIEVQRRGKFKTILRRVMRRKD